MCRIGAERDRGQNNMEYVGLVVLVAAVVAGVVTTGVGDALVGRLRTAVCLVVNPGDSARCGETGEVVATMTPLERATRGNYVALGDSYSSGEGGSEFVPGTDEDLSGWESFQESVDGVIPFWENEPPGGRNMCHRSTGAYSRHLYQDLDFEGDLDFSACSGATIPDFYNDDTHPNAGEAPQLDHLNEDTSLVTLSVGGNDVGFADVVKECFKKGILEWQESCRESMGATTREKILDHQDDLVRLYNNIQERTENNARVVVVGYPRMFPEDPVNTGPPHTEFGPSLEPGDLDEPIDPGDQQWMNEMAGLLNRTTRQAAQEAGVEFVDVYDALDGHEIGTEDSWINDLDLELENGNPVDMGSFHPNDRGQTAMARRVEQHIRNGG